MAYSPITTFPPGVQGTYGPQCFSPMTNLERSKLGAKDEVLPRELIIEYFIVDQ